MSIETNYVAKHDKLVRHLQMEVEEATRDFARVRMPISEHHKNGMGAAHGGVIFALADVAFGAAANADRQKGIVNLNSSIEFLRPGLVGPLLAEAKLVREGNHILSYDVQVFDGNGILIARCMTNGYATNINLPE